MATPRKKLSSTAKTNTKTGPVKQQTGPAGTPKAKPTKRAAAVPVIGLGASAGCLQALTNFFSAMPDKSGLAFVVIHHADPNHQSLMADLLSKHTKMNVALATDRVKIAPDHVYIIPPNRFLSIKVGLLHLSDPAERRGMRLPIDFFLRTLAEDQKQNAVAIILSGTGSDGAVGIRSIKENGGMVLVQDPKEAAHDGMPRSAISTGTVDHILPVAKMPAVISDYVKHPYIARGQTVKVPGDQTSTSLSDIIRVLREHTPINFDFYKEGTLLRRIERRMALRHMENSADYLALLKDSPEEADKLCVDLLISVTAFFRDPEAFDYLANNSIRELVENCAPGKPIRIWVPACATGEEAYSLAMLVIEKISTLRKNVKLQIFASDVDEHALTIARVGVYPDAIAADVSPERLKRFFIREDHTYRVTAELREAVVFASQNVLADAPFSRLDLISCRNLLIYLNTEAQERVIQIFHFALNDDGILFLGSSETANNHEIYFQPVSKKYRLYKRVGKARHRQFDFPLVKRYAIGMSAPAMQMGVVNHGQRLAELSQKLLIERYSPAAVLVNARMEALFVQGPADQYLKVPIGEVSQDLLAMARDGLRGKLSTVIREALQTQKDAKNVGTISRDGQNVPVIITAHPMIVDEANLVLVTFADQPPVAHAPASDGSPHDAAFRIQLEQELEALRQDLQGTIRENNRSTEELKAANEEAMSMNEEFQSTNEELETSKEELQSLNEELTTLNSQLQQKVDDEKRLSDDLNNLLSSSGIATLFLDRQLNVMRFTPAMRSLFNLIANDVGRPFSDIAGKTEDPTLLADATKVLQDLQPVDLEVRTIDGKWFMRRILPYKTQDGKIDGVVITFSDVSAQKVLQQQTRDAQRFAESIVDTIREPMLVLDQKLHIVRAGRSFLKMFCTIPEKIEGQDLFKFQNRQWDQPALRQLLERILRDKTTVEAYETTMNIADLGERTMLINARHIKSEGDGGRLILLAAEDVTERRQSQQELEEREARLSAILNAAPEAIITINERGIINSYSPASATMLGYSAEEMIGQNISMLMPEPHRKQHDRYLLHYIETGEKKIIGIGRELTALHKNGTTVPIGLNIAEFWIDGQRHFTGILHDLTEDMKRRDALIRAQKMEAVGQLTGGLAHDFNNLLTVIIGNLELLKMRLGDTPNQRILTEALEASTLGAKLTSQLLAFSRKQTLEPETVSLNKLVMSMKALLVRALGEQINIVTNLEKDLSLTLTDTGQIENVILNLALNARDAMPKGGTLTLETKNVTLDEDYAATQVDVEPGPYVALSVTDTGVGIPPLVIERVFEPFFTTKGVGVGSGLGLSMVYGFAKQSGGHVAIYSEEGLGTTVTIYLPPASTPETKGKKAVNKDMPKLGNATILVVEDDPRVRQLTVTRLETLGYSVLSAEDGPTALKILHGENKIDLVLSDVVMPNGMTGFDVADKALKIKPGLKILLATGYASGGQAGRGEAPAKYTVLRKPYRLQELVDTLDKLLNKRLDRGRPSGGPV